MMCVVVGACMRVCYSRSIPRLVHVPSQVVPVSKESKLFSPTSSYTACVHEVALDNTDVCIGGFTGTTSRRTIVSFTTPVDVSTVQFVTLKHVKKGGATDSKGETACKAAAQSKGLLTSGGGWSFAGNFATKGCYTYSAGEYAGYAFYGTGGTEEQLSRKPSCAVLDDGVIRNASKPCLKVRVNSTTAASQSNSDDDDAVGAWIITCTFFSLPITNTKHYNVTLSLYPV